MDDMLLPLWVDKIEGITPSTKRKIISYFGGEKALWEADEKLILDVLDDKRAMNILKSRNPENIEKYSYKLKERNISYIYPGHEYYPSLLQYIPDPPQILYVSGNINYLKMLCDNSVAIVGARKASAYGLDMAYRFSYEMAEQGLIIVSGLALGIDGMAHKAALDAGGVTIGVLGCGINICYPKENKILYEKMKQNGVIISEYGLDLPPDSFRFPLRNRIISGISKAVLVVEAREKSGSLITADQALEQGRDVYVLPGRLTDVNSKGCNSLIKQGAECATMPSDIINSMSGIDKCKDIGMDLSCSPNYAAKKNLAPDEKMVYSCVRLEQRHIDEICIELEMDVSDVVSLLYSLESKKLVRQVVRNYYVRC